jgi:hypothetical protein
MADFVNRNDIKNTLLTSLKAVLAKREEDIKMLQAKEAKGHAKLDRALKKDELSNDNGVLPSMDKQDIAEVAPSNPDLGTPVDQSKGKQVCIGCTGSNVEPLGLHLGQDHFLCKDCGEIGSTIREENLAAEMDKAELSKETPPDGEKVVRKLKDEYGSDKKGKEKAYATAWSIHNKSIKDKKKGDKVEKREISTVENARQAVGISGSGPKLPSVAKPSTPGVSGAKKIPDAFNKGGANNGLGKAEKTPFNDGAGTSGKPHEVIPGSDVAVDAARPNTVPPTAGKAIEAKGSGGEVIKSKLSKDEIAAKPASGIIPTAREQGNVKKGVTSLATVRQRWHGAGKMDSNDIATKLKPMMQNLPHLHASIDKLAAALGEAKTHGSMPISTVARGQYKRTGSGGSYKDLDAKAQAMGKAEGIPAAPRSSGAKAAQSVKAPVGSTSPAPIKTASKL